MWPLHRGFEPSAPRASRRPRQSWPPLRTVSIEASCVLFLNSPPEGGHYARGAALSGPPCLKIHQCVQRDAPLRRLRDNEVVKIYLLHVEEKRRRYRALVREPVRDSPERALLRAAHVRVRLEVVVPQQPFPSVRRPRRCPDGIAAGVDGGLRH